MAEDPVDLQLTVDGREVPHPPPRHTIGGFRLPRSKGARPVSDKESETTVRETETETTRETEEVETPVENDDEDES